MGRQVGSRNEASGDVDTSAAVDGDGAAPVAGDGPAPLRLARVSSPDLPGDYCEREELTARCTPTSRRMTLLMAPAGSGKTTLVAACCRATRDGGVPVAWLTLAADDSAAELDAYIAFAFREAGAELPANGGAEAAGRPGTTAVLRALESAEGPWVLVLDEVENLATADAAGVLGNLLRNAPANLRLVMACRWLPGALDGAVTALSDEAEIITAEDLFFTASDVARYFDLTLSRRELDAAIRETWGWPIALGFARRQAEADGNAGAVVVREVAMNWIAGQVLPGLREDARELLVDLGLIERFDVALAQEVLERPGAVDVVAELPALTGLLANAGGEYRLHPLLCRFAESRRRESPARHRVLHMRLSEALARRGDTLMAMGHAAAAGDTALAGRILAEADGVAVWLRGGPEELAAANRLLTNTTAAADPGLALFRCASLAVSGDNVGARRMYAAAAGVIEPALAGSDAFAAQACIVRGVMVRYGCSPLATREVVGLMAEVRRLAGLPTLGATLRGTLEYGLAVYNGARAEFAAAATHASRAHDFVTGRSAYVAAATAFGRGQAAMAQGLVGEALDWYRQGRRAARRGAAGNRALAAVGSVLSREVQRERNRSDADDRGTSERLVLRVGADHGSRAAAADLALDRARAADEETAALRLLEDLWEQARSAELPTFERHVVAARVALLAESGRAAEAERTWRAAGLPDADAACLDLDRQSWREMEALACARIVLLGALGERTAAARLAEAAAAAAEERGLVRTALRALALGIALEEDSRGDAARARVARYLALCGDSGFVRPLAAIGGAGAEALTAYLDVEPDRAGADGAATVLAALGSGPLPPPVIRGPQRKVLGRLADSSDKEIAVDLGLTVHGVRYHIRRIFGTLGVGSRREAVARARALGILPED